MPDAGPAEAVPAQAVEPPHRFHFADFGEYVAALLPDREAVVCDDRRLTFGQFEARTNRLAHHLRDVGIAPGDRVALFFPNATEYLEAMYAAWKIRAVPVNINHRYVADELRYLVDDAEPAALLVGRAQADAAATLGAERLAALKTVLVVDEPRSEGPPLAGAVARVPGAVAFDHAVEGRPETTPDVPGRSGDDHYVLYTGGTTGHPKGVVWRMEDAFYPCFGGGDPARQSPIERPEQIADHVLDQPVTYLCLPPLMHAAGQWVAFSWLWAGGRIVLYAGRFEPERVWQTLADEHANLVTIVGDAVGKPLLDAWLANPGRWDISSLFSLANGGAPISPTLRKRLVETFPNLIINDGFGSSETGAQGGYVGSADDDGVARFRPYGDTTVVLDDDLAPVKPGSGAIGRVALCGRIPLGYHNDPAKTAATFVEHEGRRWVLTGDMATVEEDGAIRLLGRGSQCINTGGEKVFPEEVEAVLQAHDAIADVVVVGVPDERWGQAVGAVVQPRPGARIDLEDVRAFCRSRLAGYKLPKALVLVDEVRRSPAGKADYRWAVATATATVAEGS